MRRQINAGIILIIIGTIFAMQSFGLITNIWGMVWPVFLLIPAIGFHTAFFGGKTKNPGVLVPGGILLVLSGMFFFHNFFGWSSSGNTWPIYLFAVAFGLFELYLFGGKQWGLLIPITVLTGLGLIFTFSNFIVLLNLGRFWPFVLILIGLALLFGRKNANEKGTKDI